MRLPAVQYADGIRQGKQDQFKGLNHNLGAKDGELWDMRNLTSDYYPLLATRAPRLLYKTLTAPGGLFSWEKLCWVDGTAFYYDGEQKGTVTAGEKTFAALGAYVVIFPDKAYYNTLTGEFGSLESAWSGSSLTFTNGKLYDEEAGRQLYPGQRRQMGRDYFKAGDAVTISGCTKHPENNKTPIIREIDGDKLYFYEFAFTLDGEDGTTPYTETGTLTISRTVPDLKFVCENENRLWGCDDTAIYASKLGGHLQLETCLTASPRTATAWTPAAPGTSRPVSPTMGYPIFFKEDHIYKVYGSIPTNFEVMGSATLGVAAGSAASLAVAGEVLFYLSRAGRHGILRRYPPARWGAAFGVDQFRDAAAGSDGLKYYVSMQGQDGEWRAERLRHPAGTVAYRGRDPRHALRPRRRQPLHALGGREDLDRGQGPGPAGRGRAGGHF